MRYQILKTIKINKKLIKPNQKSVLGTDGKPLYVKGILQIMTDESKPVYWDLPPKDMISANEKELKNRDNPKITKEAWDVAITEWIATGCIREAPEAPKTKGGKNDE